MTLEMKLKFEIRDNIMIRRKFLIQSDKIFPLFKFLLFLFNFFFMFVITFFFEEIIILENFVYIINAKIIYVKWKMNKIK